jgi:drug/metabolite transporter (DMT)-like permease
MRRWQADLVLVGITVIWGGTFVMVKRSLDAVGPATFIAWRFIAASAVMIALFHRRLLKLKREALLPGALLGLWLGLGYALQTTGLQTTSSGKTGFITGLGVVFVPILSAALFRRAPGRAAVGGVVIATAGLALLTLNDDLTILPGDLWVLGGALCFALHVLTVAQVTDRHDSIQLAVVQMAAAAGLVTGAAFLFETPTLILPGYAWGAILFTGVVATALVFSVQIVVQRYTTATHVALIFILEPPFAALFGWWLAGESLGPRELIGCALILAGVALSEVGGPGQESEPEPAAQPR